MIEKENTSEPELRPEFIKKIKRIEKEGKSKTFKNIEELRKDIENDYIK